MGLGAAVRVATLWYALGDTLVTDLDANATSLHISGKLVFACTQKIGCGRAGVAMDAAVSDERIAIDAGTSEDVAAAGFEDGLHVQARISAQHAAADLLDAGAEGRALLPAPQGHSVKNAAFDIFSYLGEEDPVWQFQAAVVDGLSCAAQAAAQCASDTAEVLGSGLSVGAKVAASHASVTAKAAASHASLAAKQIGCSLSAGAQVAATTALDTAGIIGESVATACVAAKAVAGSVSDTVKGACKETAIIAPQVMHAAAGAAEQLSVRASRVAPHVAKAAVGVAGEVAKGAAKAAPHVTDATKAVVDIAGGVVKRMSSAVPATARRFSRAAVSQNTRIRAPRKLHLREGSEEQEEEKEMPEASGETSRAASEEVIATQPFQAAGGKEDQKDGGEIEDKRKIEVADEADVDVQAEEERVQTDVDNGEDGVSVEDGQREREAQNVPSMILNVSFEAPDEISDLSMLEQVDPAEPKVVAKVSSVSSSDAPASRFAAEAVAKAFRNAPCEWYEGCSHLEGFCCPTPEGVMLGCCSSPRLFQK